MTSAKSAVELETYQALAAAVTLAPVFQDVPDDQQPPVVIIGDIESLPFGRDDDPDRLVNLSIMTVTAGDERKPCLDIQEEIEDGLSDHRAVIDGWNLSFAFVDDDAVLAGDGEGYVGTSRFKVFAFREG